MLVLSPPGRAGFSAQRFTIDGFSVPRLQIPLFSPVYQNVDLVSLRDEGATGYNLITDEKGGVERRPGVRNLTTTGTAIRGLHYTYARELFTADTAGTVRKYTSTSPDGTLFPTGNLTTPSSGSVNGAGQLVTMTRDSNRVYFADGGYVSHWDGTSGSPVTRLSVGPSLCTHVDFLDSYILGNQTGGQFFYWSDPGDGLTWPALNFAQAVGSSDILNALHVFDRKIFLFGTESLEVWENDGETPFVRIPGGFYPRGGTPTAHAVVVTKSGPVWLNRDNRVCLYDGGVRELPGPFDRVMTRASSIAAYGSLIKYYGRELPAFYFPSIQRSFVFDFENPNPAWHEFSFYSGGVSTGFPVIGAATTRSIGQCIAAFADRPGLYEIDPTYEYDDNGTTPTVIRGSRISGPIDYGTSARKRSNGIRIRLKRGADEAGSRAGGGIEPVMQIRFKDDGGEWGNYYNVGLGFQGEREIVVPIFSRGIFRTRQYELLVTDAVPFVYGFAEEDLEVLAS
jgi:hypothetical protein